MRSAHWLLCTLLVSLPVGASAQTEQQKTFAALKGLAGTWIAQVQTVPAMKHETDARLSDSMRVALRVTSRGNLLVHEMQGARLPEDPTKYDHPVTVFYLNDDGKLTLTHYCDAGNRPRMTARVSPDGKTIDFDFVDISGSYDRTGHMQHATFTLVDADHHIEDWTYLMPNKQTVRAHFELHREPVVASSGR